ncbi:MAG: leucyl aminopeptidase family protein [Candidatus Aenigmatarchaeota archaeon]
MKINFKIVEKEEYPLIKLDSQQKEKIKREIVNGNEIFKLKYKKGYEIFIGSKILEIIKKFEISPCIDFSNVEDQKSLIEGLMLSAYEFSKYKKEEKEITVKLLNVDKLQFQKARIISKAVYIARDLANEPSNKLYPQKFVEEVEKIFEGEFEVLTEVLDEKDLEREGLEGILAVGNSSENKPRLLILKYLPEKNKRPIVIIGKGVTFDTGGYNLKPSEAIYDMNKDKSGAAAVVGIIYAVSKLKLPINVIGIIPLVENAVSGKAIKPGDVIKIGNKTVEIVNTDAEGRLIIADAIVYSKRFEPEIIIDLATLTGAQVVALGKLISAFYSNDKELSRKLFEASKKTKEFVWKMPLPKFYEKMIKGEISDIKNLPSITSREAGSIIGALFIKQFVDTKWIHLDIAGPAILDKDWYFMKKGGSGYGVRLIVELLQSLA